MEKPYFDFIIINGGKEYKVNKIVLHLVPYFKGLFASGMCDSQRKCEFNFDETAFTYVMNYIYRMYGDSQLIIYNLQHALDVIMIAQFFILDKLVGDVSNIAYDMFMKYMDYSMLNKYAAHTETHDLTLRIFEKLKLSVQDRYQLLTMYTNLAMLVLSHISYYETYINEDSRMYALAVKLLDPQQLANNEAMRIYYEWHIVYIFHPEIDNITNFMALCTSKNVKINFIIADTIVKLYEHYDSNEDNTLNKRYGTNLYTYAKNILKSEH